MKKVNFKVELKVSHRAVFLADALATRIKDKKSWSTDFEILRDFCYTAMPAIKSWTLFVNEIDDAKSFFIEVLNFFASLKLDCRDDFDTNDFQVILEVDEPETIFMKDWNVESELGSIRAFPYLVIAYSENAEDIKFLKRIFKDATNVCASFTLNSYFDRRKAIEISEKLKVHDISSVSELSLLDEEARISLKEKEIHLFAWTPELYESMKKGCVELTPLSQNALLGSYIISIAEPKKGKKTIKYLGAGYESIDDFSDGCLDCYRFTECVDFVVDLKEVLEVGIKNYESQHFEDYVYEDVSYCYTEEELVDEYLHYKNSEEQLKFIYEEDVSLNTPCGTYIVL